MSKISWAGIVTAIIGLAAALIPLLRKLIRPPSTPPISRIDVDVTELPKPQEVTEEQKEKIREEIRTDTDDNLLDRFKRNRDKLDGNSE